jgi:hypothetical protein
MGEPDPVGKMVFNYDGWITARCNLTWQAGGLETYLAMIGG